MSSTAWRAVVTSPGSLAIVGIAPEVEKQLQRFAEAGVTELWPTVFPVGGDADGSLRGTRSLLAELSTRFSF